MENIESTEDKKRQQAELAYKYLLQVRDLDNQLMWTRSNILLLIQGGLLAFVAGNFEKLIDRNWLILALISIFGLLNSILWWRITSGGSFWVSYWQTKLRSIEETVFGNTIDIFRNHPANSKIENPDLYRTVTKMGYKSTRRALKIVSILIITLWTVLLAYVISFYQ